MTELQALDAIKNIQQAKDPYLQRRIEADLLVCSVQEIDDMLERHGIVVQSNGKTKRKNYSPRMVDMNEVRRMQAKGYSLDQIASMLGFARDTIARRMRIENCSGG